MTPAEVVTAVNTELGVSGFAPAAAGGQKLVGEATLSGVPVMVKVVPLPSPDPGPVLERATREVELLAEIESDRVVRVLSEAVAIGPGPDAVCWVEELLDGTDVEALLGTKWDAPAVTRLMTDLAEGLCPFHEREVVHRDLSPRNVRARANGRFTIMDPGLARHLLKQTLTGLFQPGTPGYRSPEHVPAGQPIPASDIFCLGILAFRTVTGRLPVDPTGIAEDEYNRKLREDQVESLATAEPGFNPSMCEVVDRCLNRQPARRYLDAQELLADLKSRGSLGGP